MPIKNILALLLATASLAGAATFTEDFTANPASRGWQTFGDTNLFHWNSTNQNMEVTWDSSQPNSYFYHPLGTILSKGDDFSLAFDVRLNDITPGSDTNNPLAFQIAIGLINFASDTNANLLRGTGVNPVSGPVNLVEFNYFPDDDVFHFGASVSTTMISSTNQFSDGGFTFPLELTTNDLFHVQMTYTASNQVLATIMTRNGQPFGPIQDTSLNTNFTDFRVDQIAISSYNDAGQDPVYGGSVLAHGIVNNFSIVTPAPPVQNLTGAFSNGVWQTQFTSRTNWLYTLESTADFQTWTTTSLTMAGTGDSLTLSDTNTPVAQAFYRVRATKP